MNNPTSILEQAQRRIGAAEKWRAMVGRAMALVMGLLRPGDRIRPGKRIHANHSETVTSTKRSVCVLVLVALFLTAGVGGRPGRDTSAAEVLVPPTGNTASTATLSPKPNPDGRNKDVAKVTLVARFKAHSTKTSH
jgi:hypothetical protein